jgi:hypothetical protein
MTAKNAARQVKAYTSDPEPVVSQFPKPESIRLESQLPNPEKTRLAALSNKASELNQLRCGSGPS